MTSTISKKYILIPFFIIAFVLGGLLLAQVSATTIGSNISATGNLSADGTLAIGGTATYTFGAAEKLYINATTTDHTDTTGVIDLDVDVDATGNGVIGQDITLTNNSNKNVFAQKLTTVQNVALGQDSAGQLIAITGNNSDIEGGRYYGTLVALGGLYSGNADIVGQSVNFGSDGTLISGGAGMIKGYNVEIQRTGGSGSTVGMEIEINNDTNSSTLASGIEVNMDLAGGAPTASNGIHIDNDGGTLKNGLLINTNTGFTTTTGINIANANQTMADGVKITANGGAVTDALDVSDSDIVNAINIGSNHIIASASGESPTLSSCGTSPSINGSDIAGRVTVGTGTVTSCTVNFNAAFSGAPICVITGGDTGSGFAISTTGTTSFTFNSSANMAGGDVRYICIGS